MFASGSSRPRLAVFPLNPLAATVRKGEVKERYFNPSGTFGEVLIVDPAAGESSEDAVAPMVGDARLESLAAGWAERRSWRRFARLGAFRESEREQNMPRLESFKP